jgi:hypothetical protein
MQRLVDLYINTSCQVVEELPPTSLEDVGGSSITSPIFENTQDKLI